MVERRRARRMPVSLPLEIVKLFRQDHEMISNLHASIEIINISSLGMAFQSLHTFPIGYYFDANINLNSTDTLRCVARIIWSKEADNGMNLYGCEFVGIASILSFIFEEYARRLEQDASSLA